MDYTAILSLSASGMDLERLRVELATANIAKMNTANAPDGRGYQPLRAVGTAVPASFAVNRGTFAETLANALRAPRISIEASASAPRQVYEPTHPAADARGFVSYPNVDLASEMVTLTGAVRSYEANVSALSASRSMLLEDLKIGQHR